MSGAGFWRAGTGPKTVTNTNWLALCQMTKAGPIPNLYNVLVALRNDPVWVGRLTYNEMLVTAECDGRAITPSVVTDIQEWLQGAGLRRIGVEITFQAVQKVAEEHPVHPLRDQLNVLQWDQTSRADNWLTYYLGVEKNEYSQTVGKCFLTAMAARIFEPGCKQDYMLVLEGEQGLAKSEVCRILAGDAYFSDTLPELSSDHVRLSMHLRGKWLIEIADLHAFFSSRVDTARLKSFITTRDEKYTPKYGRGDVIEPRTCLFVGTSNKENYLRDETGNRRFWPVKCGANIGLDALRSERDQLIAEAVHLYKTGEPQFPDREFEKTHIAPQQSQRFHGDAWESLINDWDFTDTVRDANGRRRYETQLNQYGEERPTDRPIRQPLGDPPYYLFQIASGALHLDRLSKAEEMRLAAVLESMGWNRATRSKRGVPWIPPIVTV